MSSSGIWRSEPPARQQGAFSRSPKGGSENPLTANIPPSYYPPMRGFGRKFRGIPVVTVLLLTCVVASAQHHERKRVERAEIIQLEQQWRQAQISENISEMDRLLAEDFLGITAAGQVVTKAQQLDRMRTRQIDLRRMDVSETKIKISGNLAVVTSLIQIDGTMDGRPVNGAFRYTRVYQRTPGAGWQITNFEATRAPGALAGIGTGPGVGANLPAAGVSAPHADGPSLLPASRAGSGSPPPRS